MRPLCLFWLAAALSAQTVTVSPEGDIRTLAQARDAARAQRKAGVSGTIAITIRGGRYALPETLVLGPEDSDTVWQAAPHEWQYGAEAVQPTEAFELDGPAVLALCESDQVLGYQFTKRLLTVAARRLYASRIRMLDLYAAPGQHGGQR